MEKINPSEITPEHLYISRRKFLTGAGALMASALLLNGCEKREPPPPGQEGEDYCASAEASRSTDELGDELTPCEDIISYNNFYEFTTSKTNVDKLARNFRTTPWTLQVGGLVNKPKTYDIDDLLRKFPPEERIYRLRCVEAWSMVIPWLGFPLAKLLKEVEPTSKAKYVRFETLYDPEQLAYNARLCTQITHPHLIAPCVSHT